MICCRRVRLLLLWSPPALHPLNFLLHSWWATFNYSLMEQTGCASIWRGVTWRSVKMWVYIPSGQGGSRKEVFHFWSGTSSFVSLFEAVIWSESLMFCIAYGLTLASHVLTTWVSVELLSEALTFTCLSESSRPCRTRWFIFRHMCPRFCSEFSTSISWLLLDMLAPISSALCTHISTALCALHAKPHAGRGHVQQSSLAAPGTGCRGDSGPGLSHAAVLRDEAENIFPKSRKEREGSF